MKLSCSSLPQVPSTLTVPPIFAGAVAVAAAVVAPPVVVAAATAGLGLPAVLVVDVVLLLSLLLHPAIARAIPKRTINLPYEGRERACIFPSSPAGAGLVFDSARLGADAG